MEMLTNVSMLMKSDLWTVLIDLFTKWLANYGWAIILFTVALKIALIPLDIYQRASSGKQQRAMSLMKPEQEALQKKYAKDPNKLNQETAKLYKKYNIGMGGMCLNLLITMGLTMIITFTLFGSMRSYGTEKLNQSYQTLETAYIEAQAYVQDNAAEFATDDEKNVYIVNKVNEAYDIQSEKYSWLWVKNVWKGDYNTSQFVEFEDYAKYKGYVDAEYDLASQRYGEITSIVKEHDPGNNGCYVLLIMSVVISFLTQFISAKITTPKGQKLNTVNKVMFAVIPLTMIILATTSNTVYTLYIIVNSIMATIISTTITMIMKKKNKGKSDEEIIFKDKKIEVVEYSRNFKK